MGQFVWFSVAAIVIASISMVAVGRSVAKGQGGEPMDLAEQVAARAFGTREAAVNELLRQRSETVSILIRQVDPTNADQYGEGTRTAAAFLLGEFRAEEAVPVLSRTLADNRMPENRQLRATSDISRYDAAAWTALVKIGRPSVPAMIDNLKATDDLLLRKKSMDTLYHVLGGKRRSLELLAKLNDQTTDRVASRRLREVHAWAEAHYQEVDEPLY